MYKYANLIGVVAVSTLLVTGVLSKTYYQVTEQCLGCICEATTGCNETWGCTDQFCGPFLISRNYWFDSGTPTLGKGSSAADSAYEKCTTDINCSALSVQKYMRKYQQDCNRDRKIDCDDFVTIHYTGGYECEGRMGDLPQRYLERYRQCKKQVEL